MNSHTTGFVKKFHCIIISPSPVLQKKFTKNFFANAVKIAILSSMQSNTGKGEIGEIFLLAKISTYTVIILIFAGSPTPPSSVWHTVTQDYVNLSWNTTSDTDCSMVMITVGDYNFLNASHQVGTATLDISEYHSNDSIVVEMYGINKCGMKSNRSTKETVKLSGRYIMHVSNIILYGIMSLYTKSPI